MQSLNPMIPYGRQSISAEDVRAVVDVLESDWLTQGPAIERFEEAVAEYCGAKFAVAVNSATSALHIACLAAGLKHEDVLWTSPNTFVASANCGLYCGADVDFVDIHPLTYNIDVGALGDKLDMAAASGKLPKVLIPVHFSGQSCDMVKIRELAGRHGVMIIEDASHAIGGQYMDAKIGSCVFSEMTVFSFHPVKIITTGEGGMVLTNRRDLYDKLIRLRSHGITRDPAMMDGDSHGSWYYQQIDLGFNYRMTDIQAALGVSQMKRLDEFVARRNFLAQRYDHHLAGLPVQLPTVLSCNRSAFHLYVIRLKLAETGKTHRQVFEELRSKGIGVNLHYIPVHTQPYYRRLGFRAGDFPEAELYYGEAISLPLFFDMTEHEQDCVIDLLRSLLR